jgi:hypothetical protein
MTWRSTLKTEQEADRAERRRIWGELAGSVLLLAASAWCVIMAFTL